MARTNQGGSVLGFVVAAIILAGLLIGGAYAVRRFTTQSEQPASASQDRPVATPQKQDKPADSGNQTPTKVAPSVNNPSPVADQLPQTGTSSLLYSVVALALLSGVSVSYARSRRPELSL